MKIMDVLLKYDQDRFKELVSVIRRTAKKIYKLSTNDITDKKCTQIVEELESQCLVMSEKQLKEQARRIREKQKKVPEQVNEEEKKVVSVADEYGDEISQNEEQNFEEETPDIEEEEEIRGDFEHNRHIWNAKVARYLAYAVDGGILCS